MLSTLVTKFTCATTPGEKGQSTGHAFFEFKDPRQGLGPGHSLPDCLLVVYRCTGVAVSTAWPSHSFPHCLLRVYQSQGVVENKQSTARSTFVRVRVNAHTDPRTRFVIADRPQTIAWAFTLSSRTSIWRFMAIWPSVECLFSIIPLPVYPYTLAASAYPEPSTLDP